MRPHLRGRGYGKELLRTLARTCVERGYARLEWWVLDWNEPAIAFYRSIGALSMDEWTVNRLTDEPLAGPGHRLTAYILDLVTGIGRRAARCRTGRTGPGTRRSSGTSSS